MTTLVESDFQMATILLADDHQLVRDTIAAYLTSSGGFIVETAEDLEGAFEVLDKSTPIDLAIIDYQMPGMRGLTGFAEVLSRYPDLKVSIISGVAEPSVAEEAIKLGAKGYFPKSIPVKSMVNGVHRVLEGEIVKDLIPDDTESDLWLSVKERFGLTSRETEILEMLAVGHSNKLIASELQLKEVTVKFHVSNIMSKLGVTNRTQAALVAKKAVVA